MAMSLGNADCKRQTISGSEKMESNVSLNGPADDQQKQQKGVTTVEYAVMLVLVAIAVIAFGSGIAGSVTGVFTTIINAL
jgi:Flp pilus assembly pilin Flp